MSRRRIPGEKTLRFKAVKSFLPERKKFKNEIPAAHPAPGGRSQRCRAHSIHLGSRGHHLCDHLLQSHDDFVAALEHGGIDLILSDFSLPAFDGLSALEMVRTKWPAIPLILVSGTLGEERAIDSLKSGATDYVLKERLARLVPAVHRAMREVEERAQSRRLEQEMVLQATALKTTANGIMITDLKGTILWVNPAFTALTGYSEQEAI